MLLPNPTQPKGKNKMKIKTITTTNKTEFDDLVSQFSESFKGKFTQTHVTNVEGKLHYTAVLFYE